MPSIEGEWSGSFSYPDGTKRDWSFTLEETTDNTIFRGTGTESRGDFNITACQTIPADGGSTFNFVQIYESIWVGQVWTYRGTLSDDGNTLSGEWYGSPVDGRSRVGPFTGRVAPWTVMRGPISPLAGSWSGEFSYPDGTSKSLTLNIPAFTVGAKFKGTGTEGSGAAFSIEGTGVMNVTSAKGGFSWTQTFDSPCDGQVWFCDGVLNADGNEIKGSWHDSSNDSRQRSAGFVLKRA